MRKIFFALLLCIGGALTAIAQQSQDTLVLPYREAVRIALKNNLDLNQQKNNLVVRQVQKNQSIAAFLPSLGIRSTASHSEGQQPNPDGGELMDLSVDNVSASIQAELTLCNAVTSRFRTCASCV